MIVKLFGSLALVAALTAGAIAANGSKTHGSNNVAQGCACPCGVDCGCGASCTCPGCSCCSK